ncbi:glycosyl hydrolase 108 family protein [Paraburkholderia caribensis]|uniref:glycosyl hydrolase 108 family protein n=1 Tax=Paraburkholderia caribensis TaxID=75105 RepID=UPI00285A8504|nr:glycosyl hydrolase 108 family protein [Paraburkholderia caribensis]MDR6386762.1 lysozyme family protein [Paraburkholderia caribensis]
MVRHLNHPTHPVKPAAPAAQPPQWQPLNWSFPFAPINGNPANPQTWLTALASGDGGFYPLGANGMFHGGIHFDAGTGGALMQGKGVQAIADGEVVAYRLDASYPELTYPTTPPRHALYSTGFVLIRHKLVLPPAPETSSASSTTASPVSSASATTTSATQAYQPPADEVLEFYSLYMHQLDWAGYRAAQSDDGSSSALSIHTLPFWQGDRHFRVGGKAGDRQAQPPQRNTPFRFDLASASTYPPAPGDGAQLGGIAAGPSPDSLGVLAPSADTKVRYALPLADAPGAADAPQGVQGVRILDRADGTVIGLLPRGSELSVVGSAVARWAQIAKILKGSPVAAVAGATPDPRAATGWVNLDVLDAVVEPKPLDTVVVLDKPYPVKAGDVVGYLGEYQNSAHSQVLPPTPKRSLLHVEVFTGAQIETFISKSQDRAKKLPESGKTLLVIRQGAKLVKCPDPQSNTQLTGHTLALAKGDPGKGCWAKVQPTRSGPQSAARAHGRSPHVSKTPVGDPLWVERQYAGKVAGAVVHSWPDFPLQIASAQGPAVGYQQVLSRAQLEQSADNGKAADDQDKGGAQWWSIAAGNADGSTILGWVCEKDHPDTQWQSPWAWPGFDTVDTTSIPLLDMYRRNLFEAKQLLDGEEEEFSVIAATVNAGPLIGKLEKAAKRQRDGNGNVTPADLKNALTVPWLAEAVSHLIVRYESEWGGDMGKWDGLSKLMGDGKYVWQAELERIKKLRWWDAAKAVKGFPAGPDVWHIHPVGLVGNFLQSGICDCKARFEKISKIVLLNEGGFVNDSNDSGGATNKGIAWATWQAHAREDVGLEPTLENLRGLTDDQAKMIYLKRYWEPRGFCGITNEKTALNIYDWTITSGKAIRKIQELLTSEYSKATAHDNRMSTDFVNQINSIEDQEDLVQKIGAVRKQYYAALAYDREGKPNKNQKFLSGWTGRVDRCLNYKG